MPLPEDPYVYFRVEAQELLEGLTKGVLSLESQGLGKERVAHMLRMAHTLKGAARVVKQIGISESAHDVEDVLARYRESEGELPRDEIHRMFELIDRCSDQLKALAPEPADPASRSAPRRDADDTIDSVRIEISQIDTALFDIAEAQVHLESIRQGLLLVDQMRQTIKRLIERAANRPGIRESNWSAGTASAVSSLADELRSTVESAYGSIRGGIERVETDVAAVRERASEFRLLPAATIFASLERAVRDVADVQRKQVVFETTGGQQRLDAHILLALRDPLIHAVRNAVVHGIEPSQERAVARKSPTGHVRLQVTRVDQYVCFRVEDDGRGLDVAGIRAIAVQRGLAASANAESFGVNEAAQLLFQGGVSTTSSVSEFSGRGVGLDVIRATARRLKGDVSLQSHAGQGTILEITTPVSMESLTVLATQVGEMTVLLPFNAVCQVLRIFERELVHSPNGTAIIVDKEVVPFRPLAGILKVRSRIGSPSRSWSVVILKAGATRAAIGVDRLKQARNAVVRPLPVLCGPVPLVAGATLNGMGNPELLLDPSRLIQAVLANHETLATPEAVGKPTVLVVDDSLTTRMLEQSILEAAGFQVDLATSGEEALVKAKEKPHSLFVVDVEMPGMNGFQLLERFRSDGQLQNTPAIMVTSRDTADDRRYAQAVGARDYIIKSEFDESRLLRTIRNLIAEISA